MCHHTGYAGYKEFRKAVISELVLREQNKKNEKRELGQSNSLEDIIETITYKNIMSLEDTKNLVDLDVMRQCISLIQKARIVYMFGCLSVRRQGCLSEISASQHSLYCQ